MKNVNSIERVLTALNHKTPDRVPIDLGGYVSGINIVAYNNLVNFLGLKLDCCIYEKTQQLAVIDEEILKILGVDSRYIHINNKPIKEYFNTEGNFIIDEWGVTRFMPKGGYYYDIFDCPLSNKSLSEIKMYEWPMNDNIDNINNLKKKVKEYKENGFAIFTNFQGILERSWELRGIENILVDLITNKEVAEFIFDKVIEVFKLKYGRFLDEFGKYLTVILMSDDLGTQNSLLFSPKLYRDLLKNRHYEIVKFFKSKTKAKIGLHSDGAILPLINDFIEIGIDILNPVQVSAKCLNDTKKLKEEFGNSLCFWGGIDTQHILPFGDVIEVKREVEKRISDLSNKGGMILSPIHNIQSEVKPENIIAMCETAKNFKL